VTSAVFSQDGTRLLTASNDRVARIWDVASGRLVLALQGHAGIVSKAAFSPDGQFVVTASWDGTARVWEEATGDLVAVFKGHAGPVLSAAIGQDGRHVVTAGRDGTARVFRCDVCGSLDELITLAEQRATRPLTADERATYLHEPAS
jgi:WD40 repeat protein